MPAQRRLVALDNIIVLPYLLAYFGPGPVTLWTSEPSLPKNCATIVASSVVSAVMQWHRTVYKNFILNLHFCVFVRMSSEVDHVVDTKAPIQHEASYGIQNVRYIFQILTDAIAMRQAVQILLFGRIL